MNTHIAEIHTRSSFMIPRHNFQNFGYIYMVVTFTPWIVNKYVETTLTFQGHVTSSVTWPLINQVRFSAEAALWIRVSPTAVEIMGPNILWSWRCIWHHDMTYDICHMYMTTRYIWRWHDRVMWCHQSRNHSNRHRPFPIGGPRNLTNLYRFSSYFSLRPRALTGTRWTLIAHARYHEICTHCVRFKYVF